MNPDLVQTAVAQQTSISLPRHFAGEEALARSEELLATRAGGIVDASRVMALDAVGAATLGLCAERARVTGDELTIVPPRSRELSGYLDGLVRRSGGSDVPADLVGGGEIIIPARRVGDRQELRSYVTRVGDVLAARGKGVAQVIQIAVATLVDNSLRHGSGPEAPALAVALRGRTIEICVRDLGSSITTSSDARSELVRRIQLPAEAGQAPPGSPVGIAWLATLIERRELDAALAFASGDGRLSYEKNSWRCHLAAPTPGFTAMAQVCLPGV